VLAVIDWEAASWGHPFEDLAYFCMAYYYPAELDIMPGFKVGRRMCLICLFSYKRVEDSLHMSVTKINDRQLVFKAVDSLLAFVDCFYKIHAVFF